MSETTDGKVCVNANALHQVLKALVGPSYLIRELVVIAGIQAVDDPISILIREFNEYAVGENTRAKT